MPRRAIASEHAIRECVSSGHSSRRHLGSLSREPCDVTCAIWGRFKTIRAKGLTSSRNRSRRAASPFPVSAACSRQSIMPAISTNKPYRVGRSRTGLGLFATKPIKKGAKIVRYFGPLLDSEEEKGRRDREQVSVRAQQPLDHRRFGAQEHRPLHQPCLQAERRIRRQAAQAQGRHPRHQEHRAGRRDQLRLRHRLLQGLSEADRLQMRGLREEAQEEARRGAGRDGCA